MKEARFRTKLLAVTAIVDHGILLILTFIINDPIHHDVFINRLFIGYTYKK